MTYGFVSPETRILIRENGLDDALNLPDRTCILDGVEGENADDCTTHEHEGDADTLTVDVVCFGALDESFEIAAGYAQMVVDVIASSLEGNRDIDDWEVAAYVPDIETVYTRRSK